MTEKDTPQWFYELFDNIAIKHNLSTDLFDYHLEGSKKLYFQILNDIESGNKDYENIIKNSYADREIGNSYIDCEDELMRMCNGNQFLFVSEFQKQLFYSLATRNTESETEQQAQIKQKLKWLGNISQLGFIIYQLAEKGYIEFPLRNGEVNYTALAERLLNAFEFKGKQPDKKYLSEQINPDSENNKISNVTKEKLKINIADRTDLS